MGLSQKYEATLCGSNMSASVKTPLLREKSKLHPGPANQRLCQPQQNAIAHPAKHGAASLHSTSRAHWLDYGLWAHHDTLASCLSCALQMIGCQWNVRFQANCKHIFFRLTNTLQGLQREARLDLTPHQHKFEKVSWCTLKFQQCEKQEAWNKSLPRWIQRWIDWWMRCPTWSQAEGWKSHPIPWPCGAARGMDLASRNAMLWACKHFHRRAAMYRTHWHCPRKKKLANATKCYEITETACALCNILFSAVGSWGISELGTKSKRSAAACLTTAVDSMMHLQKQI